MIRNEQERRNAEEQRDYLRASLEEATSSEQTEISEAVAGALTMQIYDIERELIEYEDLKKGLRSTFVAKSLDEFGEVVTKARIARGWSQTDLAKALEVKPQQVQRYESNDWQKISLWRLQEVVEALNLRVGIHAHLRPTTEGLNPSGLAHKAVMPTIVAANAVPLVVGNEPSGTPKDWQATRPWPGTIAAVDSFRSAQQTKLDALPAMAAVNR